MQMILMGSIGIGAVFGWIIGQLEPGQRFPRLLLATGTAIGLALLEIGWFTGLKGVLAACIAGTLSFFIHRLWLQALRERQLPDM